MYNQMTDSSPKKIESGMTQKQCTQKNIFRFGFGLPGFETLQLFRIISSRGIAPFELLQSEEDQRVSLIILNIKYLPIHQKIYRALTIANRINPSNSTSVDVYVILKASADKKKLTANVKAPVLIDRERFTGQQLVLERDDLPVDYQLVRK